MLVLTRKLNEQIVIGENIRVTVVGIRGNHVRLGIEAPIDVTIVRDELIRLAGPVSKTPAKTLTVAARRPAV